MATKITTWRHQSQCKICRHPRRTEIEKLFLEFTPLEPTATCSCQTWFLRLGGAMLSIQIRYRCIPLRDEIFHPQ
jgi:hypothetical protein